MALVDSSAERSPRTVQARYTFTGRYYRFAFADATAEHAHPDTRASFSIDHVRHRRLDGQSQSRPRARELGIAPGTLEAGPNNAITDVAGVRVGQVTVVQGDTVRTGVTAVLPHSGNLFQQKVAGAVFIGNAFGKLAGSTQVEELGTIESPIVLTNTLSVGAALDAVVRWTIAQPGNENVRSVNGLVGETNDGGLNDIRGLHVTREHVHTALTNARDGAVEEGAVGAGTGTVAFGWKGGIGTSSRLVKQRDASYTVGVLVQTNYGGKLMINGVPIWRELNPRPSASPSPEPRIPSPEAGGGRELHDYRGDRCASERTGLEAAGGARDLRDGAHRLDVLERQRRFRDRLLDQKPGPGLALDRRRLRALRGRDGRHRRSDL